MRSSIRGCLQAVGKRRVRLYGPARRRRSADVVVLTLALGSRGRDASRPRRATCLESTPAKAHRRLAELRPYPDAARQPPTLPPPPFPSPQAAAPAVSARAPAALAAAAALLLSAQPARADLVSDLVAKSEANKELNDAKRLATSGANFARANTVAYGSCAFPYNFLGCENLAEAGKVKFISDDLALECKGQTTCTAKPKVALPSFMGV